MVTIRQDILPGILPSTIDVDHVSKGLADSAIVKLTVGASANRIIALGIAYHISSSGQVEFVSLANTDQVYIILFPNRRRLDANSLLALLLSASTGKASGDTRRDPLQHTRLVGFGMAQTAVQVSHATQTSVSGVDLSLLCAPNTWEPCSPAEVAQLTLQREVNRWGIGKLWTGGDVNPERSVALQAWLAACVGQRCIPKLERVERINTSFIDDTERSCLAKMISQCDLLESIKPREIANDFVGGSINKDGKFELQNARFKTRVRRSEQTQVVMTDERGATFVGRAEAAKGKTTTIKIHGNQSIGNLQNVKVIGRQELTNSEKARNEFLFFILTGQKDLRGSTFIQQLWFSRTDPTSLPFNPVQLDSKLVESFALRERLNDSQRDVVRAMVGPKLLVVAHGPPGTGKTTTIAAAARLWELARRPLWIIAHSNVAVKNIAESLFKKGVDFKLLVSKEFYEEWHEHIYTEVLDNLIRTDELPPETVDMERLVGNSYVILSTLSMISNPALDDNGTFKVVPMERLIIDEASQINTFEFMHIFQKFQKTLQRVCFFGDPKQLPPFGQDRVTSIETIFDLTHINQSTNTYFLNTQYRMPTPIGKFISRHIYEGRLLSQHVIRSNSCLAFIDVSAPHGVEEEAGFSTKNTGEIRTIVHLVKNYYQKTNFVIITPYDAQRAAIQTSLENEGLPWDSVYNLDSFQGNEADYVLVSVVRSSQPGFLTSINRMNVLLTRCRKGLVIVSSRSFLEHCGGSRTLLGDLVNYWRNQYGVDPWVDWRSIANSTADLPGAYGSNRAQVTSSSYPTTTTPTPVHIGWGDNLIKSPRPVLQTHATGLSAGSNSPTPVMETSYSKIASGFPGLVQGAKHGGKAESKAYVPKPWGHFNSTPSTLRPTSPRDSIASSLGTTNSDSGSKRKPQKKKGVNTQSSSKGSQKLSADAKTITKSFITGVVVHSRPA